MRLINSILPLEQSKERENGKMINLKQRSKKGMVSIFVVIFTTMLIGIIALGFVRQMLLDQRRAMDSDLADSAYDSAMAGIADAKRAIVHYEREVCADKASSKCNDLLQYLKGNECDVVQMIFDKAKGSEVKIAGSGDSKDLEQAYTCARIKYFTSDYIRDFRQEAGEQVMVPLNMTESVNSIQLEWHTAADTNGEEYDLGANLGVDQIAGLSSWPESSAWGNRPPVLMIQHIASGNSSEGVRTLFLRPSNTGNLEARFDQDNPGLLPGGGKKPPIVPVNCSRLADYKCSVKVLFKDAIDKNSRNHFLRITKIYNNRTTLRFKPNTASVKFNGIQPELDVTGRANHIFRRLKARVEFTAGRFPYPTAAVNTSGDLCKSFEITDRKLKNDSSFSPDSANPDAPECIID